MISNDHLSPQMSSELLTGHPDLFLIDPIKKLQIHLHFKSE